MSTIPGNVSTTSTIQVGGVATSTIDFSGDQDWWQINLTAGTSYQFNLNGAVPVGLTDPVDPVLRLLSATGFELAFNDDSSFGNINSLITYTPSTSGNYYLSAQGYGSSTGLYSLTATQVGTSTSTLSIAATSANKSEGNSGSTPFTFTVTRAGGLTGTSSAAWAVTGSGTSPADAADFVGSVLPSGTVFFAAGQTTATIAVNVSGDTSFEADNSFTVTLSNASGATLGLSAASATITDSASGGVGVTERFYTIVGGGGTFNLSYEMYNIPDQAKIFVNSVEVASTAGQVSGRGTLTIPSSVVLQSGDIVDVMLIGTDSDTEWNYTATYQPGLQTINFKASGLIINDDTASPANSRLNDFVVLQFASPAIVGADAGNDTYLISGSMVSAGQALTISDSIGSNSIQLASGLSIASSQATSNALQLRLSNGGVVTVLGANTFTYDVGGNTTAGIDNLDVSYTSFVQNTLGVTLPSSGAVSGGARLIGTGPAKSVIPVSSKLDDFVVLQFASPAIVGADAGNDTYLISGTMVSAGQTLTISDSSGSNSIQLASGLSIASSQVTSNALQLRLSNGGVVTVLDANLFTYDVGGNNSAGIDNVDVSYASFAQNTLGVSVPATGVVSGGARVISLTSVTPIAAGSSAPVTATSGADVFSFAPAAARALVANTQITVNQFNTAQDKFQFDLITARGATTLAALYGVEGISLQVDPFAGSTLISFGSNANGNLVALTLAGVTTPASVLVDVI